MYFSLAVLQESGLMKAYSYPGWYQNLDISEKSYIGQRPLLAEDCLLPRFYERLP